MRNVIGDGGRHLPRDHRHPADHARRHGDLGADRHPRRDLPRRVRRQPRLARGDHLPRRRDDRHPVDRRRPVRLALFVLFFGPGVRIGLRRLGRAVAADDPDRRPLDRGDAASWCPTTCARRRTPSACRSGARSSRSCCRPRSPASSPASMLAIARVIGETAPLLIIAGVTDSVNFNLFDDRMTTLPVFIYYSVHPARRPAGVRPGARVGRRAGPDRHRDGAEPARPRHRQDLRPQDRALTEQRNHIMAKSIDVSDLDIYYGDFLAVEGVNMTIQARSVTAFIGPSGCGKSTFLRSLNRMHEVIPGRARRGQGRRRRPGRSTTPTSTRSRCAARSAWSSSGPTRSRRCRSTRTCSPATGSTPSG